MSKLVPARLKSRHLRGVELMHAHVPIGKLYVIDLDRRDPRAYRMAADPNGWVETVWAMNPFEELDLGGPIPLEMLEVVPVEGEAAAAIERMNQYAEMGRALLTGSKWNH